MVYGGTIKVRTVLHGSVFLFLLFFKMDLHTLASNLNCQETLNPLFFILEELLQLGNVKYSFEQFLSSQCDSACCHCGAFSVILKYHLLARICFVVMKKAKSVQVIFSP